MTDNSRVLLHGITKDPEADRVRMTIQFGEELSKQYLGEYDGSDPKCRWYNIEQELFMRLSDLAAKRYCNCIIYQTELMGIARAFLEGRPIPSLPIELGTTNFGIKRPSRVRVLVDRIRAPFSSVWIRWKYRHIRRQNRARRKAGVQ